MHILIVDDDVVALEMLRHALLTEGHEVTAARDGREALESLSRTDAHLVISDWEMPGLTGPQLCRAIREGDFGGYVYFVLITSREGQRSKVVALQAGADDFIHKPFDPVEMSARVRVAERILSLETRDLTIFALAKLAESRDPDAGAHLERVQNYSRILAEKLVATGKCGPRVKPGFANLIYQTSPLHDIGKVAIPDRVLLKPGALDADEFEVMKTHTTLGAQTLEAAARKHPGAEFLRTAIEIAESHHERWDGSGYPRGLRDNQIPLGGRIVALADVYDALTSKRVYKDAMPPEQARQIIVKSSGSHFDPTVVDAFIACEAQFLAIHSRFGDQAAITPAISGISQAA